MLGIACLLLAVAIAGNALVTWRVRHATRGMGTQSLAWMLDFYEGVLRAAREGLLLVDSEHKVQLVNDEARRLLGLREVPAGTAIDDLHLPVALAELLIAGRTAYDELHLGANGVVVVNQQPARSGRIVTLRDHTQLQALLGELDAVRSLAESLQAQNHEASNRLHTVVSLIEIGRPERAREFAVSELQLAQAMTDRVVGTVGDPVLASLLLAKLAQAQERGVLLTLELGSEALNTRLPAQDVVTVVGNLLDNAIEAARGGPAPRRVELKAGTTPDAIDLAVTNTGAELGATELARMFDRGWTTKAEPGHGLGLVLVRSTVERWQGTLMVDPDSELDEVPALTVRVRLPRAVSASA
jgi:sensor histidine kinase regulating citrate/malate metabolism